MEGAGFSVGYLIALVLPGLVLGLVAYLTLLRRRPVWLTLIIGSVGSVTGNLIAKAIDMKPPWLLGVSGSVVLLILSWLMIRRGEPA